MSECFGPLLLAKCRDRNKGGGWAGTSGGQVAADGEWKGKGPPASTLHSFFKKRPSEQTGTGCGLAAGSECARTPSHPTGDLHWSTSPRHVMGDLRATRSTEFAVQSRASVERQSTKGCRESAPSMRLDHMPHGAPLEDPGGPEGTVIGKGAEPGMAHGGRMAIPNMVPIHGCPDGQQGQRPSTSSTSDPGTQGDHSAAILTNISIVHVSLC